MIKLYGTSRSRAARCLWALEEVGAKYEHIPIPPNEAKSPDALKRNPNGHVPVLDDDGHLMWESMAINLYLAEKYGSSLWPKDVGARADAYKWSIWGMTEVEPHLISILRNRVLLPADQKDEKAAAQAVEALKGPLKVLDGSLKDGHLLCSAFTIADLNVASVLSWAMMLRLDTSATPTAQAWLQKSVGREANTKVRAMK